MDTASVYTATTGRGFLWVVVALLANMAVAAEPLAGTQPLTIEGDLSAYLLDGAHKFVDREIERSVERRERHWKRDFSSKEAYEKSIEENVLRLWKVLPIVEQRLIHPIDVITGISNDKASIDTPSIALTAVRWPVFQGVYATALNFRPKSSESGPLVIVVADPDLEEPAKPDMPQSKSTINSGWRIAKCLARSGCLVFKVDQVDRRDIDSVTTAGARRINTTHREFLYRQSFEGGRHYVAYEVQKVLALVDALEAEFGKDRPIAVVGTGEGGAVALMAGAADRRIDVVGVSGYFGTHDRLWEQSLDQNFWGRYDEFGDAQLAAMIAPRPLILDRGTESHYEFQPDNPDSFATQLKLKVKAPGSPAVPSDGDFDREFARLKAITATAKWDFVQVTKPKTEPGLISSGGFCELTLAALTPGRKLTSNLDSDEETTQHPENTSAWTTYVRHVMNELSAWVNYTQALIRESEYVRKDFFKNADRKSRDPAKWQESIEWYKKYFYDEVIGRFEYDLKPFNPRTRQIYDTDKYTGYEVVLDVFDDVISYGILLVPKDVKPGERRPVVVCQHGLEGRPQDTIQGDLPGERYYHQFAAKLCERGFVTFAPQNLYIFKDRFRELQRKLNPLKKTLFSIIVPQHEQICRWLKTQPFVDGERIGFYGLSYGGKSAMRIPPLVEHYKAVICSGDFNEWIRKCTSVRDPFSYVGTGEYEIWEWNLANTFNYAEMAALICPRPFMVERGHRDGVGIDEWVDYEYAKVRLLYVDLKIPERTEIEHFDGPHEINGVGAYKFLHKHLNWPEPMASAK